MMRNLARMLDGTRLSDLALEALRTRGVVMHHFRDEGGRTLLTVAVGIGADGDLIDRALDAATRETHDRKEGPGEDVPSCGFPEMN